MPRRDQLTYDLGQPPSRGPVPWVPLLVLVAVLVVVTLLVAGLVRGRAAPGSAPTPRASATSATASPAAPSPSSSPLPSGSDADEGLAAPEGSQEAATAFVRAWLDRDPRTREPALDAVAAPALAEELMLTDPANIPRASPRGAPRLTDASTYSVQFTQPLTTGGAVAVYLVADPEAHYRWLATSVEQA